MQRRRGFTLIELLVAVALGTILIGVITFVWVQSTRIFSSTVNNLEGYQRLRSVLDLIERDLANTSRTVNMEFFQDANGNGYWDTGEALLASGPVNTPALPAGSPAGSFRRPADPTDPIFGETEFCEADRGGNVGFSNWPYFSAPLIFSPPTYEITNDAYLEGRRYWRDEIYVGSSVGVRGSSVPGLVHYRLVQGADGRSTLRRRVWFLNGQGGIVHPNQGVEATDQVSLMAAGICDLKFGFFFTRDADTAGSWYHVGDTNPASDPLLRSDEERGIRSAVHPTGGISSLHANRTQFGGINGPNAVMFMYEGAARIENADETGVVLRTIDPVTAAAGTGYTNFDFPGVRPGDKIYLFEAQDDDGSYVTPPGFGDGRMANNGTVNRFPDRTFTVDALPRPDGFLHIKLREQINFFQLGRRWLIGSSGVGEPVQTVSVGGPSRTVRGSFNVRYRVAFLPPAFLVRLSIDDKFNKKVHQIERVVRLLQQ
ncbi:MAG: prepilin-type N-terminal cleavage/methylation domain-containing protein [Planctomycetes bacterium]|nr:prepilin-type N-terminal cleavage/methylation domain-containing protein [Planctomycetota bacterium]